MLSANKVRNQTIDPLQITSTDQSSSSFIITVLIYNKPSDCSLVFLLLAFIVISPPLTSTNKRRVLSTINVDVSKRWAINFRRTVLLIKIHNTCPLANFNTLKHTWGRSSPHHPKVYNIEYCLRFRIFIICLETDSHSTDDLRTLVILLVWCAMGLCWLAG